MNHLQGILIFSAIKISPKFDPLPLLSLNHARRTKCIKIEKKEKFKTSAISYRL